jgi:hypothetical protein
MSQPGPPSSDGPATGLPKAENNDIHQALRDAAAHTPRFLFRAWSIDFGGCAGFNTEEAVTPLAFYNRPGPATLEHVPSDELCMIWSKHLRGSRTSVPSSLRGPSPWVSRSRSRRVQIHLATMRCTSRSSILRVLATRVLRSTLLHRVSTVLP